MKNNSTRIPLELKLVLIAILIALVAQIASAKERKGIIRGAEEISLVGGERRLELSIDTDGNRIVDTYIHFPGPWRNALSRQLQEFIERGMEIIFDDEGHTVQRSGNILVNGDNVISIDGVNMLTLFPNEAARFKFAAQARASATVPPQSAEERRVAELEAELQRLKQGR